MQTTIDKAGRLVIPKKWRDRLNIEPGATVNLSLDYDEIIIKLIPQYAEVTWHNGIPLINSGRRRTAEDVRREIHQVYEERMARDRGEDPDYD